MNSRRTVLFLCTGNSCRSQMAEGWARRLRSAEWDAASAGVEAHGLNPRAVQVMAEVGIDISGHTSTIVDPSAIRPALVVTVCDHAAEACPVFPGPVRTLHRSFEDPPRAADGLSGEAALDAYRRVRDAIGRFVETLEIGDIPPGH